MSRLKVLVTIQSNKIEAKNDSIRYKTVFNEENHYRVEFYAYILGNAIPRYGNLDAKESFLVERESDTEQIWCFYNQFSNFTIEDDGGSAGDASLLNGRPGAYYLSRTNHTGTQLASTISDFNLQVSQNNDVLQNTQLRHTHSNKGILDATTASFLQAEKLKLSGIEPGAEVNIKANWNAPVGSADEILNKPISFPPSAHTHNASDINAGVLTEARIPDISIIKVIGLQDELDSKVTSGNVSPADLNLSTGIPNVIDSSTWGSIEYSQDVVANSLAQRHEGGRLKVADPVDSTDAVNLQTLLSSVSSIYKYKGSVPDFTSLPTTGNVTGDVWNTEDTGVNYAWTGTEWDSLGGIADLSDYYNKTEVDNLLINKISVGNVMPSDIGLTTQNTIRLRSTNDSWINIATGLTPTGGNIAQWTTGGRMNVANAVANGEAVNLGQADARYATIAQGDLASSALQSLTSGSANVTIDDTDPQNLIISVSQSSTTVNWDAIGGDQSDISLSGFTNDLTSDNTPQGITNLYLTSAERTKLTGIESGAQVNIKPDWNAAVGTDAEILNKPVIQPQVNADWNSTTGVSQILNKPTIPPPQVNSDWNSVSGISQILNKPTLGTAASANIGDFATAAQGTLADSALQPGDNISWTDLTGVPAPLTTVQAAGTPSIRAIGTTATTAAAGNHTHSNATTTTSGFMSSGDKIKLDGINSASVVKYYISPTGNDSNDGLSPATAWLTFDNTLTIPVEQAVEILLESGASFTGSLGFVGKTAGILITTYGGYDRATINMEAGNSQPINIYNCSNVTIKNIRVVGLGASTWLDNSGINIFNDTLLLGENYKIIGCEVTNVGYWGIAVGMWGTLGAVKIKGLEISDCLLHGNMDGLFTYGNQDYEYTIENAVIKNVLAYDNLGSASVTWTHSGSGIVVCGLLGGVVENCKAWNNGQNSNSPNGGPYGIWMYNCGASIIRNCESFNNKTGNSIDGGGFDIDGGCQDCVIEYCYSHNNEGPGILFYQFADADNSWLNNAFRFNTSYNDGRGGYTGAIMYGGVISGGIIHDNKITFDSDDLAILSSIIVGVDDTDVINITIARNNVFISDDILALPAPTSKLLLSDNIVTYINGSAWITSVNSKQENSVGQVVNNILVFEDGTLPVTREDTTVYIEKTA